MDKFRIWDKLIDMFYMPRISRVFVQEDSSPWLGI